MIFLGCIYERTQERVLLDLGQPGLSNSGNLYAWNVIDGLNANLHKPITILNALPVGVFPSQFKKLILPTKEWSYCGSKNKELGCINLPFIKQFMRYHKLVQLIKHMKSEQVILFTPYLPFLQALQHLDATNQVVLVVTDLPEFYDLGKTSPLFKWFRMQNNKKVANNLKRVNAFVLITEEMKKPLYVGTRPYVVIEGLCGANSLICDSEPELTKKIILYTGALHYQFGLETLLKAFSQIDNKDYELWLCGAGDAEQEICKYASNDSRIRFWGYLPQEEIFKMQQCATVLVNPRTGNGEYTKYSFPSKTMEYMLSGVPVLMYHLAGIPSEYDSHLFYLEDSSVLTLSKRLKEICEMPLNERVQFGAAARNFVLKEKNNVVQTSKIIQMLKELV